MAVGDRIKRARNLRGMTQKELGIAIGFEEKSADIRIAQYESNTRTPKEELLRKIAEVLDVNYRSLYEPTLYAAEDVMYTLFELDEHYPGTRLYEVTDTTDPDFPEKHMAVTTLNADVSFYDYLNVHPDADFKLVAQTAEASHVAIPVLKSEDTAYLDALNTTIEELRADGTLKTLSEKYFGQDISSEN